MNQPSTGERARWLDNPRNVTRIVYALYAACALLFIADFVVHRHVSFDFEGWAGFYGWFGFLAYMFIVLSAKALRKVLHRDESYYDPDEAGKQPTGEGEP